MELLNYSARKVGHIVIHWKIRDYSLAAMKPYRIILTPEFEIRGPQTTKWQLILYPYSLTNEKSFTLRLKRLDNEPAVVLVTWRVSLKDSEGTSMQVNGNQNFFKRYSASGSTDSSTARMVFGNLSPLNLETMHIECQLLVSHKEANKAFKSCSDIGLQSLSRDLLALYIRGTYSDVEIRVNDKYIRAHRAILQARSPYFKSCFEENKDINAFDASPFNYYAVDKVLSYLYSGKLEFVLGKPSILIYDCVNYFQIKEIKQHYAFDEMFLDSECDVEEIDYAWHIKNYETLNASCIQSQNFSNSTSNMTMHLRLCPKGEDGSRDLLVKVLQSRKHHKFYLQVCILDVYHKDWYPGMKSWCGENAQQIRFEQFINKRILDNPQVFIGTLNLRVKLRMCDTEMTWRTSKTTCMNTFASPNETEHSYMHLSKDIGSLFTNGVHKDITLVTGVMHFRVHKCILAARSLGFSMKIKKMISSSLDIKCEMLGILIKYLYSGTLKEYEPSDIAVIYTIAEEFNIPTLKVICSRICERKLTVQNVSDVLVFAESKRDEELKLSALKFFHRNKSAIHKEQNWQQLCASHSFLYNEAEEFSRKHCDTERSSANSSILIN